MPKLYFRVASDWDEVVKLREEIAKLQSQLKTMDVNKAPQAVKTLNNQINAAQSQLRGMVNEAAKAAVVVGDDLKGKIYKGSQAVNDFTQKIIEQKTVVKDVEADVRKLTMAYNRVRMNPLQASNALAELNGSKKALNEEKAALFGLQTEQSKARLSVRKLKDEYALYNTQVKDTASSTLSLGKAFGVIGGVAVLKQLGSEIINVRGQFRSMEISLETMVGESKAKDLLAQIKQYAAISPLELKDVQSSTEMMIGFGIEAEKVPRYIQAIGDISRGESGKFQSLSLAFSQMSAAGKLMGQDLLQMINAGFNPLQIIAQKTGKSMAELKNEMSKGAISTEMVQQAFIDATSAGGKFYGMSQKQSQEVAGQMSMLSDAIDSTFNDIGKQSEGFIMSGIKMTTSLVQNYETVGKVIAGIIAIYGTYRAAVMLTMVLEQARYQAALAHMAGYTTFGAITEVLKGKITALNATLMANPYAIVAASLVALIAVVWAFHDSSTTAQRAQKELNNEMDAYNKKLDDEKAKTDRILSVLNNTNVSTTERRLQLLKLKEFYPEILAKYKTEADALSHILEIQNAVNEAQSRKQSEVKSNLLEQEKEKLEDLQRKRDKMANEVVVRLGETKNGTQRGSLDIIDRAIATSKAKIKQLKNQINTDIADNTIANGLKGYTASRITASIKAIETAIAKAQRTGSKYISVEQESGSLIYGKLSMDKGSSYLDSLKKEQEARKAPKETYGSEYEDAKEKWLKAKKVLQDIEKDKAKYSREQYENAKKNSATAEKAYKDLGGATGSALTRQENQAEKIRKQQEKSQEKNNEEMLALRRKNQQDEANLLNEGTEKKIKQIQADFDAQSQEIEKRAKELAKNNKAAAVKEVNKNGLTAVQQAEIDKANKLNADNQAKQENEVYESELQMMWDYLREYGTCQQKKLAIAQEYDEKIAKSTDKWQKKSLEKQKNVAIQQVEINAIKQDVDWGSVFGEFGTMFKEQLQPTIDKLRAISKTEEFQSSTLQEQQILYDLIKKLEQSNATWDSDIFKRVSDDMIAYQSAMNGYIDAQNREKDAVNTLVSAKENLKRLESSGSDTSQAKLALKQAEEYLSNASDNVQKFGTKVKEATSDLESSSAKAVNIFQSLENGLQGITSGNLKGIVNGTMQFDKLFNGGTLTKKAGNALARGFQSLLGKDSKASKAITDALGSTGMAKEIISAILGIFDTIGEVGISGIVTGLQDTVFNSIEKMLEDVLSGDIIIKPVKNALSHVGNILDTVTFGGFSSWTNSSNAKEVADTTNRLTSSNEILKQSIDALKDEMENAKGADTVKVYDEAIKKQKELIVNTGDVLAAQMGYHGSHHSNDYYIDKTLSDSDWQRISKETGSSITNTSDLWNLSPEDLKKVSELTDIWDKIYNGGKYDKSDYLDQYLELAGTLEDLTDELKETLTQTTFDNVYDNFVDTLMDMEKSAEDFQSDLSKVFMKAILSNQIGQEYADKLKAWYNKFAEDMKDGTLSDEEREALKNEYMGYVDAAIKERDELANTIGYTGDSSSSQSSTSKTYDSWSQTDADEVSGRLTAVQEATEEIKQQNIEQTLSFKDFSDKANEILTVNSDIKNIADDTRNLIANTYLETVAIRENTGAIIKPIKDMAADMAEVKKNTSKL